MDNLKQLFTSKKFYMAIFGAVVWPVLIAFVPPLEPLQESSTEISGVIMAYLVGQGWADSKK